MTTTDNRPAQTFPVKITKHRDSPESCPAWCDENAHSDLYASDFGEMESAEEYEASRKLFQEHRQYMPELPDTFTMTYPPTGETVREGGFDLEVMVRADGDAWAQFVNVHITGSEPGERVMADLTSGEARSYAAQLIAAADMIETGRMASHDGRRRPHQHSWWGPPHGACPSERPRDHTA
jgi:hypothetical protein